MANHQATQDNKEERGFAGKILHAKFPPWLIALLETILVVASLFLAIRSLVEVVRDDLTQWSNLTVIASIIVAVLSTSLYLDARLPGESKKSMWVRIAIVTAALISCSVAALSYT